MLLSPQVKKKLKLKKYQYDLIRNKRKIAWHDG